MKIISFLVIVLMFLTCSSSVWADTSDEVVKTLADTISKAVDASGKKKVSVLDFKDLRGDTPGFGRAAAEDLSIDLVNEKKQYAVMDRANLREVLKEMQIAEAGLINPAVAQKFGQLSGVDALVVGQVIDGHDEVAISVKVISMETAEIIGAAKGRITKTKDIADLMSTMLVVDGKELPPGASEVKDEPKNAEESKEGQADGSENPGAEYTPGARLDIWLRPDHFQGGIPNYNPIGKLTDVSGVFNMGAYYASPSMAVNIGRPVVLRWKTFLKVSKPGRHDFLADFRIAEGTVIFNSPEDGFDDSWRVQLKIDGKLIMDKGTKAMGHQHMKGTILSLPLDTAGYELKAGYHDVEIIAWNPHQPNTAIWNHNLLTFVLRDRAPEEDDMRDLGASDFYCKAKSPVVPTGK